MQRYRALLGAAVFFYFMQGRCMSFFANGKSQGWSVMARVKLFFDKRPLILAFFFEKLYNGEDEVDFMDGKFEIDGEKAEDTDLCQVFWPHPKVIEALSKEAFEEEKYYYLSEFFKIFGDSTRLKIIHALSKGEICVCDLAEMLGATQSAVSHQLKMLRQFRIVKPRKEGKMVFYSLTDSHVTGIFMQGLEHISEE